MQAKPWSLDADSNVRSHRYGLPIVPELGGIAHAYCGTTMEAAIRDLLPWFQKPRLDDMLKRYIIKSRLRQAENWLLAQTYSTHLCRQGMLPPHLLQDVLLQKTTAQEAKKTMGKVCQAE